MNRLVAQDEPALDQAELRGSLLVGHFHHFTERWQRMHPVDNCRTL